MEKQGGSFAIREQFYLNGKPFRILSGAVHYFRIHPADWEDRLRKLAALGCNTVETYVPWNLHEPEKGVFDFCGKAVPGMLDIRRFVNLAGELGLWVILRPSPYICAEWEFGGLPAWLLAEDGIALRSSDARYLAHVRDYYRALLPVLAPLQITHGGPVLMVQVENEYGSYGNDKRYLEALRDMLREGGIDVPLFSSDGPQDYMLGNTHIDGVFPVANFGSRAKEAFACLREYNGGGPVLCGEFWLGWFDAWGDAQHHRTDAGEAAAELEAVLEEGSVNFYMFAGGTSFGFMNGANDYGHLTPDVTSYDYDALLTEDGRITEKYERFREVLARRKEADAAEGVSQETSRADAAQTVHLLPERKRKGYGTLPVREKVGLFEALPALDPPVETVLPRSMERVGQSYGYMLYATVADTTKELSLVRFYGAADRAQVFVNGEKLLTLFDRELEEEYEIAPRGKAPYRIEILVENMGRVNYGPRMVCQRKGIDGGMLLNGRYWQSGWRQYPLPMEDLSRLNYGAGYTEGMPAFYRFVFAAEEAADTFVDCTGWGKGCVLVNGFVLGRFWEIGPQRRLYLPGVMLRRGENEIVVFETEGKCADGITLCAEPMLG